MNCPKCEHAMVTVQYGSIEVDRYAHCKGIWFDMLEAQHLKELNGSAAVDAGNAKTGRKYSKVDRIKCPVCTGPMLRMVDNLQPHIWYESCPVCYGMFFDAGEFRDFKEETILDHFRDLFAKERT